MATKKRSSGSSKRAPWKSPNPKSAAKRKTLSSKQKASAKARAKRAGRPYPNLVDNMNASRKTIRKRSSKKR